MTKLKREDIYLITKYSNWKEEDISTAFKNEVFSSKENWAFSLQSICFALGIGFLSIGIMFFFAYNWDDLSKMTKFSIVEGIVIVASIAFFWVKKNELTHKILSTAFAFLIGVMFAVYGQIYQTGANAYDFFLSWSMSIVLIVLFTNFEALWLLFISILTTTFHFYKVHESSILTSFHELLITYFFYVLIFVSSILLNHFNRQIAKWWFYLLMVSITTIGTILFIYIVFDSENSRLESFTVIGLIITYTIGLIYALNKHKILDFSCIIFSVIIMVSALIIKSNDDEIGAFLTVSLFIILSVVGLVHQIVSLQKKWKHESN